MIYDSIPTLSNYHPHLSREIIERYNNLVRFLNSLTLADKQKLNEQKYFELVLKVYQTANSTTDPLTHPLTIMMLNELEYMYDFWAEIEETIRKAQNSPIHVKKRIYSSPKSPQSFFSYSSSTDDSPQPSYFHSPKANCDNCVSNVCSVLAFGAGVLGIIGVAVALEPVAWIIGLVTLTASPLFFCVALTIYASAVATCFIAAVVFGVLSSATENQKAMEASAPGFGA